MDQSEDVSVLEEVDENARDEIVVGRRTSAPFILWAPN